MEYSRKPHVIMLRFAAVLLILVALSSSMVAGRYARYTTSASGSDSARVAKFDVKEENTSGLFTTNVSIDVAPGLSCENAIFVTNGSEVTVGYTISVNNPYQNLPLQFEVKIDEDLYAIPFTGIIVPNSTATYTLITTWTGDSGTDYAGKVDLIELTLEAIQID